MCHCMMMAVVRFFESKMSLLDLFRATCLQPRDGKTGALLPGASGLYRAQCVEEIVAFLSS